MNKINLIMFQKAKENMAENIKKSGIPLKQLSEMTGLSQSALRNIINKKSTIRGTTLLKLCDALNMKVDDFIGREELEALCDLTILKK